MSRNFKVFLTLAYHAVLDYIETLIIMVNHFNYSSIIAATFNVQNITPTLQRGGRELNVHCDMAKGAEDKNCTVEMRNEAGVLPRICFPTSRRNATCKLSGLALGNYTILAYDQGWKETPAVEHAFPFAKKPNEDLMNR